MAAYSEGECHSPNNVMAMYDRDESVSDCLEGEFHSPNNAMPMDDTDESVDSECENVHSGHGSEGLDLVAINCKQDIVSLDFSSMGPEQLINCHFANLEIAYTFYNWYGRMNGFSARKGKIARNNAGEAIGRTFMCHKQGFREDRGLTFENRKREPKPETRCGCRAKFRVHIDQNSQRWYVTCFDDVHNHERVGELYCGMLAAHRKMTDGDILQMNNLRKVGIGAPDVFNSFASQAGGYGNIGFRKKDMYNQIDKERRLRGSDAESAVEYLRCLALNDPLMFVRHTEDSNGRLQHLFWCDGNCQMDYFVFGDVVAFDATYGKNKYHCPVVVFSGVNNHNHTVVFASALITNETEDTYVWLLEQFLEAMKGKAPTSVITDGDISMKNAIRHVFPNAHHRLCAWHLIRNAASNVAMLEFIARFRKCMLGDYDIGQFKRRWNSMVADFGLEDNNWVNEMYEKRHMWATAYIRGNFFAGFRTTSRCEGLHSLISKFVRSRYNLTDFLQHFQRCVGYLRFKEIEADFASVYGEPVLQTNFHDIERSAAKILTRELFLMFRDVLGRASLMNVVDSRKTSSHTIYKVVKYRVNGKEWHVTHYPRTNQFKCSCQRMESFGLPCDHIIALLVYLNMVELPSTLVLDRWSKAAKERIQGSGGAGTNFWDSDIVARYVSLVETCREMCSLACPTLVDFNGVRDEVSEIIVRLKDKNIGNVGSVAAGIPNGNLRDPMSVRRRRGATQKVTTSGIRTKRTTKCSTCRVPGHNRLTCPLMRQHGGVVEHEYGHAVIDEDEEYDSESGETSDDESV